MRTRCTELTFKTLTREVGRQCKTRAVRVTKIWTRKEMTCSHKIESRHHRISANKSRNTREVKIISQETPKIKFIINSILLLAIQQNISQLIQHSSRGKIRSHRSPCKFSNHLETKNLSRGTAIMELICPRVESKLYHNYQLNTKDSAII